MFSSLIFLKSCGREMIMFLQNAVCIWSKSRMWNQLMCPKCPISSQECKNRVMLHKNWNCEMISCWWYAKFFPFAKKCTKFRFSLYLPRLFGCLGTSFWEDLDLYLKYRAYGLSLLILFQTNLTHLIGHIRAWKLSFEGHFDIKHQDLTTNIKFWDNKCVRS